MAHIKPNNSLPTAVTTTPLFLPLANNFRDFGGRPKAKMGFVNWGEHGWTFAVVTADDRLFADGVSTDRGCAFIGMSPNCSCEVEVVTPRHVVLPSSKVRRFFGLATLNSLKMAPLRRPTGVYGDAAIVMGTLELKGAGAGWGEQHTWVADPDAHPGATLRFTRVFIRRNGKWLLAAIHNALPPPPVNK